LDLGELTRGCCSSRAAQATPVRPMLLTGLTGATLGGFFFARVNVWVCSLFSCVGAVSRLGQFGGRLACLAIWGLSGLDRSDRCVAPA
jgi:hypothetical protein